MNAKGNLIDIAELARENYTSWVEKGLAGTTSSVPVFAYDLPVKVSGDNAFVLGRCWVDYGAATGNGVTRGCITKKQVPADLVAELAGRRKITVRSFAWNGIRLRSSKAEIPIKPLSAWLTRWQGPAALWENAPGTTEQIASWLRAARRSGAGDASLMEPKNVVHGIVVENAKTIYIDFGSAEIAAFKELIDCLEENLQGNITIDTDGSLRDVFMREIEDRLYESHVAHVEVQGKMDKAGRFLAWFAHEAEALALLAAEAYRTLPEASVAGEELDFRLEDALSRLDGNIGFTVTPGEQEHKLLLSSHGWTYVVPLLKKVAKQQLDVPGWHVQVFQPPEAVDDCLPRVTTRGGQELTFKPAEVFCALAPQVGMIDVLVYFDQHHRVAEPVLDAACKQLIGRLVGELEALCLGLVRNVRRRDELAEPIGLTEFAARYEAEANKMRNSCGAILKASAEERAAWNLAALEPQIQEMERVSELFRPIAEAHDDAEETDVFLAYWVKSAPQRKQLTTRYEDNFANFDRLHCLAGEGWSVAPAAGRLLRQDGTLSRLKKKLFGDKTPFDFRAWLKAELAEVSQMGAILYEVRPSIGLGSVAPGELTAMELHEEGEIAKAVEILSVITELYGQMEEGRLDGKLGLWYLDLANYTSAVTHIDWALDWLTDKDILLQGEAWTNLGIALQYLGHMDEALESYNRALSLDPDDALRHYNLGQALALSGEVKTGLAHLRLGAEGSERFRTMILEDADLDPLRSDPGFQSLVADLEQDL